MTYVFYGENPTSNMSLFYRNDAYKKNFDDSFSLVYNNSYDEKMDEVQTFTFF